MTEYEITHGLSQDAPGPLEPVEVAKVPESLGTGSKPIAHWYAVDRHGAATLCTCEEDARETAAESTQMFPNCAPYTAVQLVPVSSPTSHPIPTGATGEDESGNLRFSARRILDAALWWAEQRVVGPTQAKAAWEALEKHTLMQLRAQRSGTDEITARHAVQTLADAIYASAHRMGIKNGDNTALSLGQCLDLLNRMSAPAAGDALLPNLDLNAAAKTMAECMDYPWAHMPEQGREQMRKNAKSVIDAAIAQQKGEA